MEKACARKKPCYLCPPAKAENGSVAQLDRASHYGCEGLGFESLQGHQDENPHPCGVGFLFPVRSAAALNWSVMSHAALFMSR